MVKIYIEGGGNSDKLHRECRQAFRQFLENAGLKGNMPRIVACGGRAQAYDSFRTATSNREVAVLLVDSEQQVMPQYTGKPWNYLRSFEHWEWLDHLTDTHCHLMTQCMESWFLADRIGLEKYFGNAFNINKLSNGTIESISKEKIFADLKDASRDCKNGSYDKGRDSFKILMRLDTAKVLAASPWAKRFVDCLIEIMQSQRN